MTTRLRLKRTLAEEQERARRKAYRAAKRAAKRSSSSRKGKHAGSDGDLSPTQDDDAIKAELEEVQFREKMWSAFGEDERLDGLNARFNDYAHIPDRWSRDEHDLANPQHMDDDEYAEWVREGMWKKKHAREYEEQAKRDAEKAAHRARERAIKADTTRLQRLALEQEESRRKERLRQREEGCRQQYERRWRALLDTQSPDQGPLTFLDIPWPLFPPQNNVLLRVQDITPQAVTTFLLPDIGNEAARSKNDDALRRNRDKLKETLLRFHPDKFEGRLMHRVLASDIDTVREAVGCVARVLNTLMSGSYS